jgi:molecular chaperone GrpE (heat shock protein)
MKHQKEVKDFYENNSTLKEQYLQLEEKLENINKTIQTIREAK